MKNKQINTISNQPSRQSSKSSVINIENSDVLEIFGINKDLKKLAKKEGVANNEIKKIILSDIENSEKEQEKNIGSKNFRSVEKSFLLQIIDHSWKDHLLFLDYLKQGISLRAYGQKDPLSEFRKEAFELFETLLFKVKADTIKFLINLTL